VRFEPISPDDGIVVRADPFRVSQLVGNIVGNAIKFTPPNGSVRLQASLVEGQVVVEVDDTGPGIPANDIPHLFDNFWQARKNDHRGVGLGLAIAKGVVEAHGGQIWCESTVGAGTKFFFTLPVASGAK
jgi:signal transduction histidine kinase